MNKQRPVPRLNLAPKLNRPLSLFNPLDYLRLLYWAFYFPQALRWYVQKFGDGKHWNRQMKQLAFQALLLAVTTASIFCCLVINNFVLKIVWLGGVVGVGVGILLNVFAERELVGDVAGRVVKVVVNGVLWNVTFWGVALLSVRLGIENNFVSNAVIWGAVSGVILGVELSVIKGLVKGSRFCIFQLFLKNLAHGFIGGVLLCIILILASVFWEKNFRLNITSLLSSFLILFTPYSLSKSMATLRPDSWLGGTFASLFPFSNRSWLFSLITPLPLPYITYHIYQWLRVDWTLALKNINEILACSRQLIPITKALNRALAALPSEQLIFHVAQVAHSPYDWDLVKFAAASTDDNKLRLDTPARAAAAGFWYLHESKPEPATVAFEKVRSFFYGEEMFVLAQTLTELALPLIDETTLCLQQIATLQLPLVPRSEHLRPTSWQAIQHFYKVIEEIKIVQQGLSRSSRSLAFNRALGEITAILDTVDTLPEAERDLIQKIAEHWKDSLLKVSGEIGNIQITSPVRNPYVVGDPVQGSLFVGREDILRELEELWLRSNHRPSVVLYGHRRMGKTSILRNLTQFAGEDCCVIYVNLQGLGAVYRGTGEVLIAIADKIAAALNTIPPDDTELLTLPERTFERFLQRVFQQMQARSLIVALDEFETLENLIEAGKIPSDFLAYLRSLIQMDARLAFAFAGLHTLQEMTADYFQPFFASVVPIRVSFLDIAATRQLLANPDEDFPLDYTREACDRVHSLTRGQPFLVQLLGFQLVRRYNRTMFEEGRKRDSAFSVADVDSAINDEFFQRGRYYFEGVARQAARGAAGQGAILRALAPHRGGLSEAELKANLELDKNNNACINWNEALATLKRHDVIEERSGKWCIAVELFRLWYLRIKC